MTQYIYGHWAAIMNAEADDKAWDEICERLNDAGSQGWEVAETIKTLVPEYPEQYKIRFLLKYKLDGDKTQSN